MSKRVSLKGKGADLFFGDYRPDAAVTEPVSETAGAAQSTMETVEPDSTQAVPPASTLASKLADEQVDSELVPAASQRKRRAATKQASTDSVQAAGTALQEEDRPALLSVGETLDAIWSEVARQAPITGSFRYTEQELALLTDATYELSKRHGVKFSKQDVARLALNAVLWDYQAHGEASLLASFVQRKRRHRDGH